MNRGVGNLRFTGYEKKAVVVGSIEPLSPVLSEYVIRSNEDSGLREPRHIWHCTQITPPEAAM
jgi:hypothetical protein